MESIKSRSNRHIKFARKVRDGGDAERFFVEGKRLSAELLNSHILTESIYFTDRFAKENPDLSENLGRLTQDLFCLNESLFAYLSGTKSPQGIAAVCKRPTDGHSIIDARLNEAGSCFIVLLHQVNNPGNLGAIARSAEAFGAVGLIVTKGSVDAFSAPAVRGSMGSAFRLPVWSGIEFEEAAEWASNNGVRVVCADRSSEVQLTEMDWDAKTLIVFGSEAHGLSESERDAVDQEFRISISEKVESLNLAVAAGITLCAAQNSLNLKLKT